LIEFKEIRKKNIISTINDNEFWEDSNWAVTKHRLYSNYRNPFCDDEDIILLIAYLDKKVVGYLGCVIGKINHNGQQEKFSWLSTIWVNVQGQGLATNLVLEMNKLKQGKMGISAFNDLSKRVFDKSGVFNYLEDKIILIGEIRSNLKEKYSHKFKKFKTGNHFLGLLDNITNMFINYRLKNLKFDTGNNLEIEYVKYIDEESSNLIKDCSKNDLCFKDKKYLEWLSTYVWIYQAPLSKLTKNSRYFFSDYEEIYQIYQIKVIENGKLIGFLILQNRGMTLKVLYAFRKKDSEIRSFTDLIYMHAIKLKISRLELSDSKIKDYMMTNYPFFSSSITKRHAIISKLYDKKKLNNTSLHYGDGDSAFV
jgi:hypothetical protein